MSGLWPNTKMQREFFEKLRALLDEYPHFAGRMAAIYEEQEEEGKEREADPEYDPKSPVFLNGIVLILNHMNLEGFEGMSILKPNGQSKYLTSGLISKADYMQRVR